MTDIPSGWAALLGGVAGGFVSVVTALISSWSSYFTQKRIDKQKLRNELFRGFAEREALELEAPEDFKDGTGKHFETGKKLLKELKTEEEFVFWIELNQRHRSHLEKLLSKTLALREESTTLVSDIASQEAVMNSQKAVIDDLTTGINERSLLIRKILDLAVSDNLSIAEREALVKELKLILEMSPTTQEHIQS